VPSGGPVPKLVRLVQLDGKLPNLALMKLAHWHRQQGWDVQFTRHVDRGILDREPDAVYGSCIFKYSRQHLTRFVQQWPQAVVGGTGSDSLLNVEHLIGQHEHYDYSIYPGYLPSIGFTQRGCRLKCGFCVVPQKEGRPIPVNSIRDIWRGEPYPKDVVLLDNDFFGQPPEEWKARVNELIDGQFRVSFNQGLNVRLIHEEGAHWRRVLEDLQGATCSDCHRSHDILPRDDPASSMHPRREPATCAACHSSAASISGWYYGVKTDRLGTYQESYHSRALKYGDERVATCTDCHEDHAVRAATDRASAIHPDNLPRSTPPRSPKASSTIARRRTAGSSAGAPRGSRPPSGATTWGLSTSATGSPSSSGSSSRPC